QDAMLWDASQIDVAETLLREASRSGPTGRYQLEAAIQSAHTARRLTGQPNWPVMDGAAVRPSVSAHGSPVVWLNRAMALAEIEGPEAALTAIEPLGADNRMLSYQPYWAARGTCCRRPEQTRTPLRPIALPSD